VVMLPEDAAGVDGSGAAVEVYAATRMQALERGRQARSLKRLGPPFTPEQRRRLEDALSVAVNAAMGLEAADGRLGFIARHLAAQDDGREPLEAPPRQGRLTAEQNEELTKIMAAVSRAVNAANCRVGSPLRNVAEHLLSQHRVWRSPQGSSPISAEERKRRARQFVMLAAAPKAVSQKFVLPAKPTDEQVAAHDKAMAEEDASDPLVLEARRTAKAAFKEYDGDGSGSMNSSELFEVLLTKGLVPPGSNKQEQQEYLSKEFAKADSDGSGTVDFDEFVTFYVDITQQVEAETKAREAFSRFDADGSNSLGKAELFQVLLELDVVVGDTKAQKEAELEREFAKADADGGGTVDFEEFISFYTAAKRKARSSGMKQQRAEAQARREQRKLASKSFLSPDALMAMLRTGDVALLSARWVLARAGFAPQVVDRGGRRITKWLSGKREAQPLPCRQTLQRDHPEAFLSADEVEKLYARFRAVVKSAKGAERDGVDAVPVVAVSHCWEGKESADPAGRTLHTIASELGRQFPTFHAWGLEDLGVFFDWSCVFQDTVDVIRSKEEETSAERAVESMPLLYAHKQTTVFLIVNQRIEPAREVRGWPFYEESLTRLFKEAPPPKRYKLPEAGPTHLWQKVVRVGDDTVLAVHRAQGPPIAPTAFMKGMQSKQLSRPADRDVILTDYRKTIAHGFSGLDKLILRRRGWDDADLRQFAIALKEVECPQVTELDLSANDMSAAGLEALGAAITAGALHALETLTLSDCSGVKALPEAFAQLHSLQVLNLDGCIGISTFPASFAQLASLKTCNVTHCQKLISNAEALSMLSHTVQLVTEKKR
jgi:Ca2+-binding EF-hand superfamily protein